MISFNIFPNLINVVQYVQYTDKWIILGPDKI